MGNVGKNEMRDREEPFQSRGEMEERGEVAEEFTTKDELTSSNQKDLSDR